MDHSAQLPVSTTDFPSPKALKKAAEKVQNGMIRRLPASPEYECMQKFQLVQSKIIPSKKEIMIALLNGYYTEFL